jgi:hypothetical protein
MMRPPSLRCLKGSLVCAAFLAGLVPASSAFADDAKALLKAMSDYMAKQKDFSFTYESTVEAVTPDFQKLQFVSSGSANVSRPDKIHVTRTGGFADVDVTFDGKTLTVYGKNSRCLCADRGEGHPGRIA